jgi:hypothetical protein
MKEINKLQWSSNGESYHTHAHGFRLATSATAYRFRKLVRVPFYDTANTPRGSTYLEVDSTPAPPSANGLLAYIPRA